MKLYVDSNYLSPYAMTAFVALKEKGLDFEMVPLDLQASQQNAAPYTSVSGTQRVPTLCDGDFNLSESSAICEYLDEVHPDPRLFPSDIKARAKAREIQAWLRSDLMPIRQERSTEVVFRKASAAPLSSAAQAAAQKLFAAVDRLLPQNESNLFGPWCIADTDLALMLNRLVLANDVVPQRLATYAHHQWARASVQNWVQMARP